MKNAAQRCAHCRWSNSPWVTTTCSARYESAKFAENKGTNGPFAAQGHMARMSLSLQNICAKSDDLNAVSFYDSVGNRLKKLEDAVTTTYAYDAANQFKYYQDNTGRTTYTFDANGNQQLVKSSSGGLTTHTWDYENRLTKVVLPTGARNTMAYDADGKRVKKEDSSGTCKFVWDAENILLETNALDVTQVVYTQQPVIYGSLLSQYRDALSSFYHLDAISSTAGLTNGGGLVTDSYAYTAFGLLVITSGSTVNNLRYLAGRGHYLDVDRGQYSSAVTVYDPPTARVVSRPNLGALLFLPLEYQRDFPRPNSPFGVTDFPKPYPPDKWTIAIVESACQRAIDESPEAQPEPPELTPEQKRCCEGMVDFYYVPDPTFVGPLEDCHHKLQNLVALMAAKGCSLAREDIHCLACNWGGKYIPGSPPRIELCFNNLPGRSLCTVLLHELLHAYQDLCTAPPLPPGSGTCSVSLVNEFQAYYCAGQCAGRDFISCVRRAIASSCGIGNCKPSEIAMAYAYLVLWYEFSIGLGGDICPGPARPKPPFFIVPGR